MPMGHSMGIIWKNNGKLDELKFVTDRLFGFSLLKYGMEKANKDKSFSVDFFINQDGLTERDFVKADRDDFKEFVIKACLKELPLTFVPFTGKISVHIHDLKVVEVHFTPKQ